MNHLKDRNHHLSPLPSHLQLDAILQEKLDRAFHQQASKLALEDMAKIAVEYSAIDLARAVCRLPLHIRPFIYDNLIDLDNKVSFMIHTDSSTRAAVFRHISNKEAKKLISTTPPNEAVSILHGVSERRFRKVMELLDAPKAARIREIKSYERNTAGRIMTNEFFWFSEETTVAEAIAAVRENPGVDLMRQVFVLNASGQLQGYVPVRNLLVNSLISSLREIMRPILHKVSPNASREEIVDIVERYKLSSLPVVESNDLLIGIITYEDIIETMEDLADETIAQMSGTEEKSREHKPTWQRLLSRIPWLIVTLFAGLINVGLIGSLQGYEGGILAFVIFFVPLITGLSGNVGIQCSTVLVRSMATGSLWLDKKGSFVFKEMIIGVSIGVFFGLLAGTFIWGFDLMGVTTDIQVPSGLVAIIVGIGLCGACLTSTSLGVFSPFFFSKLGVDPAIASGPIVTAINDFLSMSIYFLIAIGLKAILL